MKSPGDKHKLVVDEFASQIVKRIFKEFLSGKFMYKIAEGLSLSDEQKVKFNDIKTEIASRMDNFSKDREKTKEEKNG